MKFRILFFLLLTAIANHSKAQIITTIAGNGYIGDGGPAVAASLRSVWNVGTDAIGNVYVADAANNRVRKIDKTTGIITTIAGNGIPAHNGDGMPAVNAFLNYPTDVFIAPSGNIYIAENGSYTIRKITVSTGIITTVAGNGISGYTGDGGLATLAQIGAPWRLCVDKEESIYYTDNDFYIVRKIDGNSGIITTIAGNGTLGSNGDGGLATAAQFGDGQNAICVDASNNIYIADFANRKIRKINANTGIINTVAGGGASNADGILATNASLGSTVRSVSLDAASNIYIGINKNCRKVNAVTGIITTVVGTLNGSVGFSGDGGLATAAKVWASGGEFVDSLGNIFVADHNNYRVRKVDVTTGIINTIAGIGTPGMYNGDNIFAKNASLANPISICIDSASNIFIADAENYRIRKINGSTGLISTIAGNGVIGDPADGSTATQASVRPTKVNLDGKGNIYFSGFDNRIRKIDAVSGIVNSVAGNGSFGSSGDGGPAMDAAIGIGDFCLDAAGNIYLTDPNSFSVRKVDVLTGIISTIAGTGVQATDTNFGDGGLASIATFGSPNAVYTDNQNNIYISDYNFGVVRKITAATGIITTIAGNGILASDPLGDGGTATAAALSNPTSLFADTSGNIFIQDKYSIRKVTKATGIITTIVGNKKTGFSGDGGDPLIAEINNSRFALNKAGTILYISDNGNNRIRKVSFNTTTLCPPIGNKALTSNITGASYKWQINNGTGFTNLSDNANYTGTSTGTVQLNNIPSSWAGYEFRCLVDGNYSEVFTLKFLEQWTGAVNTAWENVANWSCSGLPDANTDVVINAGSTIVINSNVIVRSLQVSPGANLIVSPGSNLTVLY